MSEKQTALIIGAGIGGLAAGLALRRAGWNIRVHERAASSRELGFGLGLAPNALSALHELGVAEPVVRAGAQLAKVEFRYTNGRVLRRLSLQFGFPAVVALRPDLHGALLTAVGDEPLRLAREAVSVSEDAGGITVHFNDGSTDTGTMLVGADGVHSTIRKCLHPHERPPRSRRTGSFIRMGPRIARITTTPNIAIRTIRSLAIQLTPERLLVNAGRWADRN